MTFLLDTCLLWKRKQRDRLAGAAATGGHRLVVPTLVHAERTFQLRRQLGAGFDAVKLREAVALQVTSGVISIQPLDQDAAEELAATMGGRFATESAWILAKRREVWRALGLGTPPDPSPGARCGAFLDLYLAGLATLERPIITDDANTEWATAPEGSVLDVEQALQRMEVA